MSGRNMESKYRMCISQRMAIRVNYIFVNFIVKFTYKCNTVIGELMSREIRSGRNSLRSQVSLRDIASMEEEDKYLICNSKCN